MALALDTSPVILAPHSVTPRPLSLPLPLGGSTVPPQAPPLAVLEVVPLLDILLHEDYDAARAVPLGKAIARAGMQRHPVILARTGEGTLLQLDGANRLTALRRLHCRHVVAQVVDYSHPEVVSLQAWVHLTRLPPLRQLHASVLWEAQAVEPVASAQVAGVLAQEQTVAVIIGADQAMVAIRSGLGVLTRLAVLRQLVAAYALPAIRVSPPGAVPCVTGLQTTLMATPEANAAVVFGPLRKADIMTLVAELSMTLPAGVTRHVLTCGRILNVNVPLTLLQAQTPTAEKTAWLHAQLAQRSSRLYVEPTLVYEEE